MSTASDRAALIERQGAGARYDAVDAPVDNLLLARRGTAYFSRFLNELEDEALVGNRARLIAEVGYTARGLARLMQGARTGVDVPEHASAGALAAEITKGTSLPARALRGLFHHSAIHLDVEWRDLPSPSWDAPLLRMDGSLISARDTPLIRATAIWQAALDLGAGGRIADVPPPLRGQTLLK